ncbi:MAG: TspO and like protein [Herbinix sp.]|nr:TspO and like protein [Herbinix sp.]
MGSRLRLVTNRRYGRVGVNFFLLKYEQNPNKPIKWKELLISIAISLGVGALSGFLTRNSMSIYQELIKPPLSPPGWLFPVVWTILYVLMGISAYLIYTSDSKEKDQALLIYALQLIVNFCWSLVFFNQQNYLLAFTILVALWVLIILMYKYTF